MTVPKWAMERAKDIRQEWMRIALTEDKELALPAGHLSLMASFIAAAHKEGWEAMREAAVNWCELPHYGEGGDFYAEGIRAIPYPDPVEKEQP